MSCDDYCVEVSKSLIGKTIKSAIVNGHYIELKFDDGYMFDYEASDGGYSTFSMKKEDVVK